MVNKFRVGDKVKRVRYIQYPLQVDKVYEVVELLDVFGIVLKGLESDWLSEYFELVEEESSVDYNSPKFKEMEFESNSEEEAKRIQDVLFELGYEWASAGKRYAHVKSPMFSTNKHGYISWGYFCKPTHKVVEKKSYEIVPVEETIEYNGKKYNKQDFEQAIAGLEIV